MLRAAIRQSVLACASIFHPHVLEELCILISGSVACGRASPKSDVDLVLLADTEKCAMAAQFRALLVQVFDAQGFPNTDCVIVPVSECRCVPPGDLIDRHIAYDGRSFLGAPALLSRYLAHPSYLAEEPLELLLRHVLMRQIDSHWMPAAPGTAKHMRGGMRELMRLEQYAAHLTQCVMTAPLAERISAEGQLAAQHISAWDAYRTWREAIPGCAPLRTVPSSEDVHAAAETIESLGCQAENGMLCLLPLDVRDALIRLRQRASAGHWLSLAEANALGAQPDLRSLVPYAMSLLACVDDSSWQYARTVGWLAIVGLLANPRTPDSVLHEVATLPGYESRNLRDQVPKHPNVSMRTLEYLATSGLAFTRQRARGAIASLRAADTGARVTTTATTLFRATE